MQAIHNVVAGNAVGGVRVKNDDPMPTLSVTPATAQATEGGKLVWKATLSAAADSPLYLGGRLLVPAGAPELSTTDVDPTWFTDNTGQQPEPSRPLSSTRLSPFVYLAPGAGTPSTRCRR